MKLRAFGVWVIVIVIITMLILMGMSIAVEFSNATNEDFNREFSETEGPRYLVGPYYNTRDLAVVFALTLVAVGGIGIIIIRGSK